MYQVDTRKYISDVHRNVYAERGVEIHQEGGNSSEGKEEEVFLVAPQERGEQEKGDRRGQNTIIIALKCIFFQDALVT